MTSVNPLVQLQTNRPGKALTAYITNKGFMINVDRLVSLEVNSVGKSLTAHITKKSFFAAHITKKRFITSVSPPQAL